MTVRSNGSICENCGHTIFPNDPVSDDTEWSIGCIANNFLAQSGKPSARVRCRSYPRNPIRPSLALWGRHLGTPTSQEISLCHGIVGAIACIKIWLARPRTAAKRICKSRQGAVVPPSPASSKQMRSAERLQLCHLHSLRLRILVEPETQIWG
jgi:hypothetical protein